jgi:hypothetical protein
MYNNQSNDPWRKQSRNEILLKNVRFLLGVKVTLQCNGYIVLLSLIYQLKSAQDD